MVRIANSQYRRTPIVDPSTQATIGAIDTGLEIIEDWDTRIRKSEIEKEANNASIASIEGFGAIDIKLRNSANQPDIWEDIVNGEKKSLKEAVLKPITYKEARDKASAEFDLKFAKYLENTKAKADIQRLENVDTDFDIGEDKLKENIGLDDTLDAVARMSEGDKYYDNGFSGGVSKLPTTQKRDEFKDKFRKDIADKYIVNTGEYVDNPNQFFEKETDYQTRFTEDEIADLKKEYDSLNSDRKAQAQAERKANAEAKEKEIVNDVLRLADPNAPPEEKLTRDQIRQKIIKGNEEDVFVTGEQSRVLSNFLDSKTRTPVKENDHPALAEAYKIMATDMTQQQKFDKIMSLSSKLESNTVDGFVKDIYEPETVSSDIYKQYSSAINSLKTNKMFSSDRVKNVSFSVKAQNLLKRFAKENPEASEKEYENFFNKLIENQSRWWAIVPGGRPWSWIHKERTELMKSIPLNIAAMEKEYKATDTDDLTSMSDEELLKRIMGK
jgi:hypothetical protein